jgi:hypothetical protein
MIAFVVLGNFWKQGFVPIVILTLMAKESDQK